MKKKTGIMALVAMCILFVVGLVLIFSATSLGVSEANSFVVSQGGSVDTNQFERVLEGAIFSYQIGGMVISLVGGFGILLSGYVLYK